MNDDVIMGLGAMAMLFVLPALWIVCHYTYLCWKQSQSTALIRDMIARGFTPQEIIQMCQVLGHRTPRNLKPASDVPPAKPVRQPAYSVSP